jgi:hypothetical protein
MAGRVRALAFGATLTLIGGCATAPAQKEAAEASEPAPGTAEASAFAVPWPDAADCRALAAAVLAMADSDRQHLRPEDAPLALAIADGPLLLTPEEAAGAIDLDLPIPVAEKTGDGRCLIAASRPRVVPGGGRRLVGHELVRSEYRTRTRRSVNPEYAKLREEAEEESGGGGRVMATGEPSLDLIGLVGGAVIRGINRLRPGRAKASEQLAKTERYLETPVYEPYTYDISAFEVGRVGALEATLLDRAAGRAFEARHTMRERHTFAVAEGRHRADRGVLEGGGPGAVLPEDVAVFETSAPRPRLSDLLQILAQTTGEGDRPMPRRCWRASPPYRLLA